MAREAKTHPLSPPLVPKVSAALWERTSALPDETPSPIRRTTTWSAVLGVALGWHVFGPVAPPVYVSGKVHETL